MELAPAVDITIIVPTFNRPRALAVCLANLTALEPPPGGFDIVVVDDGGSTDLAPIVAAARTPTVEIQLFRQPNRGPGAARNLGAREARGQWLAFTDDDCLPRPSWLVALHRVWQQEGNVIAGGRTVNGLVSNPYSAASQLIVDAAYRYFNDDRRNSRFLASNNLGLSRTAFLDAGGFDESFRIASEDRELCDRWLWRGGRIVFSPEPIVEHRHHLSFAAFLRQHYRYGRGAAKFHQVRAARGVGNLWRDVSFRQRWRELLWVPARTTPRPFTTACLLVAWQFANTAGFLRDDLPRRLFRRSP